ncbi:MAG: hypothetical protein KC619_01705 [Myxococcales bacterium]|nr:hypothetical protein [Myxococcales bacterium]
MRHVAPCALALALLAGCPEAPETFSTFEEACAAIPDCEAPRVPRPPGQEAIWRVSLVRDADGQVRIDEIDEVSVAADVGLPPGPLAGSHALVARGAGGETLGLTPVRFPEVALAESLDFEVREALDLSGAAVHATAYLRVDGAADRIVVLDATEDVVDMRPAPAPGEAVRDADGDVGGTGAPLAEASPACAHVALIEGEADRGYLPTLDRLDLGFALVVPGPTQRAVVRSTLNQMTPLHCAGISRIAFVHATRADGSPHTTLGGRVHVFVAGDLVLLNVEREGVPPRSPEGTSPVRMYSERELAREPYFRLRLTQSLLHEGGHALEALLTSQSDAPGAFRGDWMADERGLAEETIARVRLGGGLHGAWGAMHDSFVALGWAHRHPVEWNGYVLEPLDYERVRTEWTPDDVVRGGAMSHYGMSNPADDLADMLAWSISSRAFDAAGIERERYFRDDWACRDLRAHETESLPARLAAVYTKLSLLRDLGAISEEAFDSCVGSHVGIPVYSQGVALWENDEIRRVFDRGVHAEIGATPEGRHVFQLAAEGSGEFDGVDYPAVIEIRLDLADAEVPLAEVGWPRGAYPLLPGGASYFHFRMDDAPAGSFDVIDGFALVTDASNDRIRGSVFITRAIRPSAPLAVPQTFDPPLIARFLIEH